MSNRTFLAWYSLATATAALGAVDGLRRVVRPARRVRKAPVRGAICGGACLGLSGVFLYAWWETWRERKEHEAELYPIVKRAVDRADPIGLLALGAPPDEYDPEVRSLVQRLARRGDLTGLDVALVFHEWFGTWIDSGDAIRIASTIREEMACSD
jgi:hypothetical protein